MRLFPFSVFVVRENSMLPAFLPGDHVVTFNWGRINVGDVVVFKTPRSHLVVVPARRDLGQHYIKRVCKISTGKIQVVGDNKKASVRMPAVFLSNVVGTVVWKY